MKEDSDDIDFRNLNKGSFNNLQGNNIHTKFRENGSVGSLYVIK
jgi:hypothetical protein